MKITFEKKTIGGFVLSILLLVIISIISYQSTITLTENAADATRTQQVLTSLSRVLSTITDAETGQRGYVITGDTKFLEPYQQATKRIDAEVQKLKDLTNDNPRQRQHLNALVPNITARLALLNLVNEDRRVNGFDPAQREIASGSGRYIHDNIRALVAEMEREEKFLLHIHEQETVASTQFTQWVIVSGGLLTFLILVASLMIILKYTAERKQTEAKIKKTNAQLSKLNAEKDKFFSIIAHDLRSPFQGFINMTELMAEDIREFSTDELSSFATEMHNSAKNLFKLLKNLLEWAQMQNGTLDFSQIECSLNEIITQAAETLNQRIAQKGIVIINEVPESQKVFADPNMISTILRNLLSNAVKFSRKNGKITLNSKTINDEMIEVSVHDTGMGISDNDVNRLFMLGEKVSSKGTEGEPSSGLGLLLCKEFVTKNGGEIWVESEEGKGSTFYFTVPKMNLRIPNGVQ